MRNASFAVGCFLAWGGCWVGYLAAAKNAGTSQPGPDPVFVLVVLPVVVSVAVGIVLRAGLRRVAFGVAVELLLNFSIWTVLLSIGLRGD